MNRRSHARVSIRLSKSDRALLMRAASAQGKSVRRFLIASALRAAAESVEQGHTVEARPPDPGPHGRRCSRLPIILASRRAKTTDILL